MSLSLVAFMSCEDDKENASSNGGSSVFKSGTENGHDYVDLGLTSGTRWATCNVGASKPQDYGNYYAWGETTTKSTYSESTYKFGSTAELTKYCSKSKYGKDGFTDSKTTLDLSDDAAYVNWGGKWRMPTKTQQDELREQCYWVWTGSYNGSGIGGYIVYKVKAEADKGVTIEKYMSPLSSYSLSDAHIFLPAAGCRSDDGLDDAGSGADYWSSSLRTDYPFDAWHISFYVDFVDYGFIDGRYYGRSVRAVCPAE